MRDGPEHDVGASYRRSRLRLEAVLRALTPEQWTTAVPACPGWRVHDVVAHLVGVIEDAAAGHISGPPDPAQTAAEVERHRTDPPRALLHRWSEMAPVFEEAISAGGRWPAYLDMLSHEHDISGALGRLGPRDLADVQLGAELLGARPGPNDDDVLLDVSDGDPGSAGPDALTARLRTTPFEVFRLRLGRRTRDQALGLDWSTDPTPVLAHLFIFGPALEAFPD